MNVVSPELLRTIMKNIDSKKLKKLLFGKSEEEFIDNISKLFQYIYSDLASKSVNNIKVCVLYLL
jgi:hypothetical protein